MKNLLAKAAVAALALSPLAIALPAHADVAGPIDFESPTYNTGSIHNQDGWSKTGGYDVEVETNSYDFSEFQGQVLRISNAITSGSFGDQTFSKALTNEAGELDAMNGGMSSGPRQSHFEAEFDFASTQLDQQPGLFMSVSPDRGDGARMSYLGFTDSAEGIDVNFFDVQGTDNPANFVGTVVATGLSRDTTHMAKFVIDFFNGPSNDVVQIYIDDTLAHTGTTWENYYRYDDESNPGLANPYSRTVDSLLFRVGGTAAPDTSEKGFLVDNLTLSSSSVSLAACPEGTIQGLTPETLNVPSNSSVPTPSGSLAGGQNYLVVASGTWTNRNNANQAADAEYATLDNWDTVMDGYDQSDFQLGVGEFDLLVDADFVDWGAYDTNHSYSLLYTGTGAPASFMVFDGDSDNGPDAFEPGWYGDNSGSLIVNIYPCMPEVMYVTGGGNIKGTVEGSKKTVVLWTFGGNVWSEGDEITGNFQLTDHANKTSYHFNEFPSFSVTDDTASFHAVGWKQGSHEVVYADFAITDNGEPGAGNDTITVTGLASNPTGIISGGNFQVFVQE